MTLITGIANFKGGVVKTKNILNISASLLKMKGRVLMIDTEPHDIVIVPNKAQ